MAATYWTSCAKCGDDAVETPDPLMLEDNRGRPLGPVCRGCYDGVIASIETLPSRYGDEYIDVTRLGDLPRAEPLIDGVLMRHSYHLLIGRDGTLKTFTALDWACCLVTNKRWQGRPIAAPIEEDNHRVLYVVGEGAYGFEPRVAAWEQAWRTKIPEGLLTVRKSAVNLYRPDDRLAELCVRIEDGYYGLVVFDTLRRMSGGADANSSDMGVVVDSIERIKRATWHGAVLVIAHTDKSDTDTRGFSGIEDDADVVWHARRDECGVLTLKNTKMKDGPDGATIRLRPNIVTLDGRADEHGKPVTSLILEASHEATSAANTEADDRVMVAMRETFALTGASATELIEVTGLSKSGFYEARGRLLQSGQLVRTGPRTRSRLELPSPGPSEGGDVGADLLVSGESGGVRTESARFRPGRPPLEGPDTGLRTGNDGANESPKEFIGAVFRGAR